MSDNRYNGWTNYETWNVNLWIDNDQGSHEFWSERAVELCEDSDWDKDDGSCRLADELKEHFQENMPEVSGTYADLLQSALDSVDWREIAEHFCADVEQPEGEPEEE